MMLLEWPRREEVKSEEGRRTILQDQQKQQLTTACIQPRADILSPEWLLFMVRLSEAGLSQKLYSASICKDETRAPHQIRRVFIDL